MADRLLDFIGQVTADEFYRHDTHYNRDSRLGRELLYLIANDDWIRSTTEVINLNRSDVVDSVVKVNVDTDKITHEAFRDDAGPLWLPLLVVTMPDRIGWAQSSSPGQLTVVDSSGSLLAPMREADVWHAVSAALSEIFITIADNQWPWKEERRPGADRDQRVLLSAAIFHVLSRIGRSRDSRGPGGTGGSGGTGWSGGTGGRERYEESDSPLGEAKRKLTILLRRYFKAYARPAQAGPSMAADTEAKLLTERAADLLYAFTRAVVVVVGVNRSAAPAVLTLTAPTRQLQDQRRAVHRVLRQLQPRARLEIDLLLASGDADRQVEVSMPDGVSIDLSARRSRHATPGLDADIVVTVDPPPAAGRLATLMDSVLAESGPASVPAVRECLAGLALTQADTFAEVLDQHLVLAARPGRHSAPTEPYAELYRRTDQTSHRLDRLRDQLRLIAAGPADAIAADAALAALSETWDDGGWLRHSLMRRTAASVPSPDTLTGRAGLLENTRQRVPPGSAKVTVPVEVTDARFYSIARFSGAVSIVLILVVLAFYTFALAGHFHNGSPDAAIVASTLTLFSVIQAGRVEPPDRSTLRGRLTGAGNWLIIASILPTVVLAVAIAFDISGWAPVSWSICATAAQTLFLLAMWRGPLSAAGSHRNQPYRVLCTRPTPAYGKTGVLRSVWWQTATANALLLGRQAHGYLIWEHRSDEEAPGPKSLRPVLGRLQPGLDAARSAAKSARMRAVDALDPGHANGGAGKSAAADPEASAGDTRGGIANILAMMRSGTTREAVTFVVLREPPAGFPRNAVMVPLDIDPDRLTPTESATEHIDVLVGISRACQFPRLREHPVFAVLRAAKQQWLQVMETQLPVPPPTMTAPADMLWGRVRIGFREPEYPRIAAFLHTVSRIQAPVWVRSWPEHIPRSLRTVPADQVPAGHGTRRELMTAQDFDVVSVARQQGADSAARTWRMLAVCVNTSFGVEYDVLDALATQAPELELAAMSHAELHGMDMFLILGRVTGEPGARNGSGARNGASDDDEGPGELERVLAGQVKAPTLRVALDEWRTAEELGFANPGPLLRVDVRTRDTPGTLQVVMEALDGALRKQLPALPRADTMDWRVVLQTGAGRSALARLTVGLPVPAEDVRDWPPARWHDVARDTRTSAAGTVAGRAATGDDFDVPEDMVVTVRPVKRERPLPSSPSN
jgi:hypothetical protein